MVRTTKGSALITIVLSAGCSLDLHTEGTEIVATATGDGRTEVTICAGPRGLLECNVDDSFTVSSGQQQLDATVTPFAAGGQSATLDGDAPGTRVVVTRDRDGATATLTLPDRFDLTLPAPDGQASRGDDVDLAWTPAGTRDSMAWTAVLDCDGGFTASYGDPTFDLGATRIDQGDIPESTGSCGDVLTIELARLRSGTVSGFEDQSSATGEQRRSVQLRLVP
jgi:hypothetical protein